MKRGYIPLFWTNTIFLLLLILGAIPGGFAHQTAKKPHLANPSSASDNRESQAFLAGLRARVLNNWLLPDGKNVVVLVATVNGRGEVTDVSTSESNADPLAIEAARTAFEKSQPIGTLPSKYAGDSKITLTFTSNVDPHGDSTSDLTSRIDQIKSGTDQGNQGTGAQPAAGQ